MYSLNVSSLANLDSTFAWPLSGPVTLGGDSMLLESVEESVESESGGAAQCIASGLGGKRLADCSQGNGGDHQYTLPRLRIGPGTRDGDGPAPVGGWPLCLTERVHASRHPEDLLHPGLLPGKCPALCLSLMSLGHKSQSIPVPIRGRTPWSWSLIEPSPGSQRH